MLVLVCFLGCETSKIEYVEEEKLPTDKVYHITKVYLKDGTTLDLKDKEPVIKLKHKGVSNVILYNENVNEEKYIRLSDVAWMKIEVVESNQVVTALAVIGITAVALILLLGILFAIGGFKIHM